MSASFVVVVVVVSGHLCVFRRCVGSAFNERAFYAKLRVQSPSQMHYHTHIRTHTNTCHSGHTLHRNANRNILEQSVQIPPSIERYSQVRIAQQQYDIPDQSPFNGMTTTMR